jgi:hypothetical protein
MEWHAASRDSGKEPSFFMGSRQRLAWLGASRSSDRLSHTCARLDKESSGPLASRHHPRRSACSVSKAREPRFVSQPFLCGGCPVFRVNDRHRRCAHHADLSVRETFDSGSRVGGGGPHTSRIHGGNLDRTGALGRRVVMGFAYLRGWLADDMCFRGGTWMALPVPPLHLTAREEVQQ